METTFVIRLTIEGDPDDAQRVLDDLLDAGVFQDPINDHDCDEAGPLHVLSAIARPAVPFKCRYSDCAEQNPVAADDEQVTCHLCRKFLGLPDLF